VISDKQNAAYSAATNHSSLNTNHYLKLSISFVGCFKFAGGEVPGGSSLSFFITFVGVYKNYS